MYTAQPKKMLIMNILDILKKYTDENHRLSQKEIADILKSEYDMTVERKAVKRNLMNLIDFGYEIEYSESVRMVPNRSTGKLEESYILSDFYLVRDFTDSELRLLIFVQGSNISELCLIYLYIASSFFTLLKFWTRRSASSARSPLRTTATAPIKDCIRGGTATAGSVNMSSIPIKLRRQTDATI